eukprot:3366304-Amphidinium_carterae.1
MQTKSPPSNAEGSAQTMPRHHTSTATTAKIDRSFVPVVSRNALTPEPRNCFTFNHNNHHNNNNKNNSNNNNNN